MTALGESQRRVFWSGLPADAVVSEWLEPYVHPRAHEAARRMSESFGPRRRVDFINGRACASLALHGLGIHAPCLPRGAQLEPLWPTGIAGSITHTTGYCAAVAVPCARTRSIGIDAECRARISEQLIRRSCSAVELAFLRTLPISERMTAAVTLFSAKESLFKCLFPLFGPIDRLDADIQAKANGDLCVTAFHRHPLLRNVIGQLQGRHLRVGALTFSYIMLAGRERSRFSNRSKL